MFADKEALAVDRRQIMGKEFTTEGTENTESDKQKEVRESMKRASMHAAASNALFLTPS